MFKWIQCLALMALSFIFVQSVFSEEATAKNAHRPVYVVETTQGKFEVTLFPDIAPKTVENFTKLVDKHYYDGTTFHRVIPRFMIQGGDPLGNGTGGQSIWGRSFEDEFSPTVNFDRKGYLAMANKGPNTNGSQFFITTVATPHLNQKHTIFGEVSKGYDVVQKIENVKTDGQNRPIEKQEIVNIYLKNKA